MNVRVLLTATACLLTTGCCLPPFACNPGYPVCHPAMMSAQPGTWINPFQPSPSAGGPQFRSFHDGLVNVPYRKMSRRSSRNTAMVGPAPLVTPAITQVNAWQEAVPCEVVCQPAVQQVVPMPQFCTQPQVCPQPLFCPQPQVCLQPYVNPEPVVPKPPRRGNPWKLSFKKPQLPGIEWETVNLASWLPVIHEDGHQTAPCGEDGCTSIPTTLHFTASECGESIPAWPPMTQQTSSLSPVPAPPSEDEDVRYFPNSGEKRIQRRQPADFDPPPAAEQLPEPPPAADQTADNEIPELPAMGMEKDAAESSGNSTKPPMTVPIDPFEDIEDSGPDAPLPVEAQSSNRNRRLPNNAFPPLKVPATKAVAVDWAAESKSGSQLEENSITGVRSNARFQAMESSALESARRVDAVQQVAASLESGDVNATWEAIELDPPIVEADVRRSKKVETRRTNIVEDAQEWVPVERVISRRRQ